MRGKEGNLRKEMRKGIRKEGIRSQGRKGKEGNKERRKGIRRHLYDKEYTHTHTHNH